MYIDEFRLAETRSKKFGLSVPNISFTNKRFLTENVVDKIPTLVQNAFGVVELMQVHA